MRRSRPKSLKAHKRIRLNCTVFYNDDDNSLQLTQATHARIDAVYRKCLKLSPVMAYFHPTLRRATLQDLVLNAFQYWYTLANAADWRDYTKLFYVDYYNVPLTIRIALQ